MRSRAAEELPGRIWKKEPKPYIKRPAPMGVRMDPKEIYRQDAESVASVPGIQKLPVGAAGAIPSLCGRTHPR